MNNLIKCSKRGCGWVGRMDQQRQHRIAPDETEGRCPRCDCNSYYNAKITDVPSDAVLPHAISQAKFLMVCTGETYSSKIVDGGKLHEEMAIACCGSLAEAGFEEIKANIEFLSNLENWCVDTDAGPYHIKQDIGEIDHIEFWRIA